MSTQNTINRTNKALKALLARAETQLEQGAHEEGLNNCDALAEARGALAQATKKPQTITVNGRRWFQKSAGNTYFSASISVDGEAVHEIDFAYGYDDFYMQAAGEWLIDNGHIKATEHAHGGYDPLWSLCRDQEIELIYSAVDVDRKRDL